MKGNHRSMDFKKIADRMKEARVKAGLTQLELAERLGVTQGTVSQWERQVRVTIGLQALNDVCRATSVTLEFLLGTDEEYFTIHRRSELGVALALVQGRPELLQDFIHIAQFVLWVDDKAWKK